MKRLFRLFSVIGDFQMIITVGIRHLVFHFHNGLLFLKFTAWIIK